MDSSKIPVSIFRLPGFFTLCGLLGLGAVSASAQALIQFDFGSAAGTFNGTSSPGHEAGAFSFDDNTWNAVTGDTSNGLMWADGTAANGIEIDLGLGDASAVNWSTTPAAGSEAGQANGVYGTSLGNDNVYTTNGGEAILGVRVTGLAPGTYDVFAIARGVTDGQSDFSYHQAIGVGDAGADTFVSIGGSTLLSGLSDATAVNWVAGETHLYSQVTISSTEDYLVFLTQAAGSLAPAGNGYAGLQGLQISAVPEPATSAVWLGTVALGLTLWQRRRPSRTKSATG